MKRTRYVLSLIGLAIAAVVAFTPGNVANAQVNLRFTSGFQVQNLNTSTAANVTISFFQLDGTTVAGSVDVVIPAGGSKTYATLPSNPGAPSNFDGSAVLSSDQRIAAIANIVSPSVSSPTFGGEAYVGVTQGSTSVSLPFLNKAFFGINSFVNVQNVGATATDVTITYRGGGLSSPLSRTYANLQPGAAHRFDQAAETGLPAGFNGSATISATSEIAAVVTQVGTSTVQIYNGFNAGSTLPVFPLVNTNNAGIITGITLQNLGGTATNVTVSYTPDSATLGTACTETKSVPGNGSAFFAVDAFASSQTGENCANGALFVGSGRVTANSAGQPLVGLVNQLNQSTNKGGAYNAFDPASGTPTVVFPLIMDRVSGYFTGISVVNVGTQTVSIECSYTPGTVKQTRADVPAGGSFTALQYNLLGNSYVGSGTCRATGANAATAKLVGIANEVYPSARTDTLFVYEGANN